MTEFNNTQSIKDAYLATLKDAKIQLDADVREFKPLQERRNLNLIF